MTLLKKHSIIQILLEDAILPIFYNSDIRTAIKILKACHDGGVRALEFVDRGKNSLQVFKELLKCRDSHFPEMLIGAGSVYDPQSAGVYLMEGADFIVSPVFIKEIAFLCNRRKVLWIPGCSTMNEIAEAECHGAEIVKIFPAESLGYEFVKYILGPSPGSCLMVTGGIKSDVLEITKWLEAGAVCVGLGTDLFPIDLIEKGRFDEISDNIGKISHNIKKKQPTG